MSSLPTITSLEQLLPALKIWQQQINPVIQNPLPPRAPFNFQASGGAAGAIGIALAWEQVNGSDGYQLQMSTTGDFSAAPIVASFSHISSTGYFDNTTVTGVKRYYRLRATNGTPSQPQSVAGPWTSPVNATSGSGATTSAPSSGSGSSGSAGGNPGIGPRNGGGSGGFGGKGTL